MIYKEDLLEIKTIAYIHRNNRNYISFQIIQHNNDNNSNTSKRCFVLTGIISKVNNPSTWIVLNKEITPKNYPLWFYILVTRRRRRRKCSSLNIFSLMQHAKIKPAIQICVNSNNWTQELEKSGWTHIKFLFTVNLALHPFNSTQSRLNIWRRRRKHHILHLSHL